MFVLPASSEAGEGGSVLILRRVRLFFSFLFLSFRPSFYRPVVVVPLNLEKAVANLRCSRRSGSRRRRLVRPAPPALEIAKRGEGGGSMMMIAVSCFSFYLVLCD